MKLNHLLHSCLRVDTENASLLIDPGNYSPDAADQSGLDAILITHQHADHMDVATIKTLLKNNPKARLFAEPESAGKLREEGLTVSQIAVGDQVKVGGVTIKGVGGQHAVIFKEIPAVGNTGFVITDGIHTLGVTGDSLQVPAEFKGIDALFFAVVAPWSNMSQTIEFLREVAPKKALPGHEQITSEGGRGIFVNQAANFAAKETEFVNWPEDRTVTL